MLHVGLPARPRVPGGARVRARSRRRGRWPTASSTSPVAATTHDLLALGLLCQGEAAIALGQTAAGMRLLDDAMVSVTTGEVSPIPAGIVYCGVIAACIDAFDLRRAAEWTEVLTDWCEQQPDLVPFRGQCLVHRSEVLQAHGSWPDAAKAAEDALRYLSEPGHPSIGAALYQVGELHRLRGELAAAERAYREASRHGREPSPGFELLRLAQGQVGRRRRLHPTGRRGDARPAHPSGDAGGGGGGAARRRRCGGGPGRVRRAREAHRRGPGRAVRPGHGRVLLGVGAARGRRCRWARSSSCAARAPPGATSRCPTTRLGPACRSPGPAARSRTTTPPTGSSRPRSRRSNTSGRAPSWPGPGGWPDPVGVAPGQLTARQCDVLRAVATGKSNREVAAVARHQRAHRRPPPAEHLHEARPAVASGGHDLRPRARAPLTVGTPWRAWSERTTRLGPEDGHFGRCGRLAAFVRSAHDEPTA